MEGAEHLPHGLAESGGGVGEAKVHNCGFIQAKRGFESGFPPVLLFDADVIKPPVDVELCEEGFSLWVVEDVTNEAL